MSPEVEQAQISEIDRKAEADRARIRFDINLLEQNEERYREILLPGGPGDDDPDLALYNRFVKLLDYLEGQTVRVAGVIVHRLSPDMVRESKDTEIQLGWMTFSEPSLDKDEVLDPKKTYAYVQHPTVLGLKIIEQRRAVQGKPSIETARQRARSTWDDIGTLNTA